MIIKKVSDSFLMDEATKIKTTYFNAVQQINLFQALNFLYNRSIIKKILIAQRVFYDKTEKEKIDLIRGKNAKSFSIEKSAKKRARPTNCKSEWEENRNNR